MAPLNLATGPSSINVKVQPAVLLNICDAYVRRNNKQHRVVGTLLGYIADGVVEIKNCYAVPHNDTPESVDFDIPHHNTMKDLHQKVNSREVVVGWFTTSTGNSFAGRDVLIQEFYASECQNPVVLAVDTTLQSETLEIAAYVSRPLTIKDKSLATEFRPVDCGVRAVELEVIGAELLRTSTDKPLADFDQLAVSFSRLQEALDKVLHYVDDVVNGKVKGDPTTGRFLADAITSVPRIGPEELERLVADNAQDALLIMYLANLVRTQLALADRLGTAALPLL